MHLCTIVNGRIIADEILKGIAEHIRHNLLSPRLCVIQVGDRNDSNMYIRAKKRAAKSIGIGFSLIKFHNDIKEEDILCEIDKANNEDSIHGIVIQLPLPKKLNRSKILDRISIEKDVDGFSTTNIGCLAKSLPPYFEPCTPSAVIHILKHSGIELKGKHVAIIGRGQVVGNPLSLMLNEEDATVSLCHSLTTNIPSITRLADIVIAAAGSPLLVKSDWIKEGAVVIDVGINSTVIKGLEVTVGDVDFEAVRQKASIITPVIGGVGPVTVAKLLKNTAKSAERRINGFQSTLIDKYSGISE